MSTKEKALYIFNNLSEAQLAAFVTLFGGVSIEEAEPDEWDKAMIDDSRQDNDESISLDEFVKGMGFKPDFDNL